MGTPTDITPDNFVNMSNEEQHTIVSATTLANAGELGAGILREIAGNDISTGIGGNTATTEMLQHLLYQRIAKRVTERRA